MKKCFLPKAFTMIELMVSIFITITIIASFYKLYNASIRHERSSSIRVAVNLMGEQMLDTIAESIRLIGLNSSKGDFELDISTIGETDSSGIIVKAAEQEFVYHSPFGSPITKVKSVSGDTFPNCTFTLFNSAAFYTPETGEPIKLYFHNQDGLFATTMPGDPVYADGGVKLVTTSFEGTSYSGQACKDVFPVGSLVSGEDNCYRLKYTASGNSNWLTLSYKPLSEGCNDAGSKKMVNFSYNSSQTNNYYSMPKFVLEYLVETCTFKTDGSIDDCVRNWTTPKSGNLLTNENAKGIIAVRFGFVLLSKKERVQGGSGSQSGLPTYCIFEDSNDTDNYYCYPLTNLNYTASVFRRVIYLSNYRYLIDQKRY